MNLKGNDNRCYYGHIKYTGEGRLWKLLAEWKHKANEIE